MTRADEARRAIALLLAWQNTEPSRGAPDETILHLIENTGVDKTDVDELMHLLEGAVALADFLLENLERATGRDGRAFLQSVAAQADQYFPD